MSDILNYKFYLNFKNTDSFGRIEITEPIGFDGASFLVEQESKRYGRDAYKINEEINLNFYKGNFDTSTIQQLPNGTVIYNLTQGYDYLIDCFSRFGFESDVDFEIELNDTLFIPSNLDFQTSETDRYSYFSCKAVQVQGKQLIKRRADIVTDIFSTEDLDGNEVTPAQTENILLKAKPETQESEWKTPKDYVIRVAAGNNYFNVINNSTVSNIDDSLSFIQGFYFDTADVEDFIYLDAKSDLTSVKLSITDINYLIDLAAPQFISATFLIWYNIAPIFNYDGKTLIHEEFVNLTGVPNVHNFSYDGVTEIESIPNDTKLWVWFELRLPTNNPLTSSDNFVAFDNSGKINIKATSTAIDTVIKGVRYVDVFKENVKRINNFTVNAPRLDVGGQYYNQYAFTGNLIKQRDDLPFPVKFKEITEDLLETNSDYQVLDNVVYINQYQDFYANNEIGVFITSPDESFKSTFNPRYSINEYEFKYKTYEQDREESNTTDAIHTESQWMPSNKQVENTKTVNISLIRDAYKIESARKLGFKETTSTTDDDKLFVLDVVPLAPSTKGGFGATMTHNIDLTNNRVQLLKSSDLPSWALLGFGVGDFFEITFGANIGTYTVFEIEDNIITLTPEIPNFQVSNGVFYTQVEYFYTNVLYTNRTNEGLVFFENLLNGNNFSNLKYSIKRNIETWKPYLATASKFNPDGVFRNTYFKDNGLCITQFNDEAEPIQEDADINNIDLGEGILTPYLYETKLLVPFNDMVSLLNSIDTINEDNSIGGVIRCIDNNERVIRLYPQKLEYIPSTEVLTLTGEERNEGNGVDIVISGDIIEVNEVGYDISELTEPFYEYDGDYWKIYDKDKLPIINPTKYTDITVNGLTFDSSVNLLEYLVNN